MSPGKRVMDCLVAGVALLLLWPLFLIIALSIKLDDGGPAFFGQERVGRRGRPFRMWKFRTMVPGAHRGGRLLTVADDPRLTRVGRWLRAAKLDELPQLWNVCRGEMSLVGPRPEVPRYVERYGDAERRVLDLVPGMTDPASIAYRHESDLLARVADPEATYVAEIMPAKIAMNLEYAGRATRASDLMIVVRTVLSVPRSARR